MDKKKKIETNNDNSDDEEADQQKLMFNFLQSLSEKERAKIFK